MDHLIITTSDKLLCIGKNSCGQIGLGMLSHTDHFYKLMHYPNNNNIKQIACGADH